MDKKPLFSIVVSAYNIEKYICDCINSIKIQEFDDFECIIVDDGSTDNTYGIVKECIKNDDRFRLISINHSGHSAARNIGLKEAIGEYILFPDGDDTLDSKCLSECTKHVGNNDALIFGIRYLEYNNEILINDYSTQLEEMVFETGSEVADWYAINHKLLLYSSANKCYRRKTLIDANISFKNLSFGEDRIFNYDFLKVCDKVKTLNDVFYNYRHINPNSVTTQFRHHHIDELIMLHEEKMNCILNLSKKISNEEKLSYRKYDIFNTVYNAFIHLVEHKDELSKEIYEEELRHLSNSNLPDYFYINSHRDSNHNLIEYINQAVFFDDEEIDSSKTNTAVVLGSKECKYRIENALKKFGNIRYICCGGNKSIYKNSDGSFLTEADFMGMYLNEHGITDIEIEDESTNTYGNIINASSYIRKNENVVITTAAFHKKRVIKILNDNNLHWKVFSVYGPNSSPKIWFNNIVGLNCVLGEYRRMM